MNDSAIRDPVPPMPGALVGTRQLLQVVERYANAAPTEQEGAKLVHDVYLLVEQHRAVMLRRSSCESPQQVARWMLRRVDKEVVQQARNDPEAWAQVPCRRGCNACCYQRVTVAEPEAKLALEAAQRAGHVVDYARAKRQVQADYGRELTHADKRCVMLRDDGDCAIYADRPMSCRSYQVVTPPELCDSEAHPGGRVAVLSVPMAEVVQSGAARTFKHGSLAAFVVEAHQAEALR